MAIPRESWLKSDDPEKFADAMGKCQHAGGYCAEDGFCHFDGDCFEKVPSLNEVLGDLLEEVKALRAEVRSLKEGA